MKGIIYKATNSLSGMVYIGQTKSGLSVRRAQHLQDAKSDYRVNYFHFHLHQCPESFEWEVLDEFRGTDAEVSHALNVAEEYWILKYDATNPDKGYNSTAGGYASDKMADHVRKRLNCQQGAKAVLQYDLDGNFIREFPSLRSVAAEFDMPKLKSKHIFKSSWHGFMWRLKDGGNYPLKIEPYRSRTRKVKVAKYDYNGDLVCIYPSLKEARNCNPYCSEYKRAESLSIREQYSDKVILMNYGFVGENSVAEHIAIDIIPMKPKHETKPRTPNYVSVFDLDGKFVGVYDSVVDASKNTGVGEDTIRKSCLKSLPYIISANNQNPYIFRKGRYFEGDSVDVIKVPLVAKEKPIPVPKVLQYSLDGEYIRSYMNISEASAESGDSYGMIRNMCLGVKVTTQMRFQWQYYTDGFPINIGRYEQCPHKRVSQYNLKGEYIVTYDSISTASALSGDSYGLIRKVCMGGVPKKGMRYQWRYASC